MRRAGLQAAVMLAVVAGAAWTPGARGQPGPADAPADSVDGRAERARFVEAMWERVARALDAASAARQPPEPAPDPVEVRWQARRVSSIDLGAPLLALRAFDLDADGRAELVAVTSRELVVVAHPGHRRLAVRARAALPDEPASTRPRDPVGSLVIADMDGDGAVELMARSSEQRRGAVFAYRDAALVEVSRFEGFPLCAGAFAALDPGRNYFDRLVTAPVSLAASAETSASRSFAEALAARVPAHGKGRIYGARCRRDLVDATGRPLAVAAALDQDDTLHLWARAEPAGAPADPAEPAAGEPADPADEAPADPAEPARTRPLAHMGVAFEIADIDRDGHPEIVVTAATPPGDSDRVVVLTWKGDQLRRVYGREFTGGVAAVTAADIDADGIDDVVAAVRSWGSHRVDLWTFN